MAPSKSSWADEMEEEAVYKEKLLLPTAPRAARGSDVDESKIPNCAPYTAYIANLPYDIEVEDVGKFFHGLSVKSVRLPRDGGEGGRLRGFGYAEFETRQDLVDALTMNELMIKNRKIRVDIASGTDGQDQEGPGGMGGAGRGRGRPRNDEEREDRTPSDWRNAPREGPPPSSERPGFRGEQRGGDRGDRMDRDNMGGRYDASFNPRDRAAGVGGPPERSSFGPPRGGRDGPSGSSFGSSYGRDRDGPSSYDRRDGSSSFGRDRDGPSSFSRGDRDGPSSFSRGDRDGPSSFSRGDRDGPSSFSRGDRDGPSSFGRDRERPVERAEAPKERPKLSLKPRTVPVSEETTAPAAAPEEATAVANPASAPSVPPSSGDSASVPQPQSSAAIFGGAKPVDTAARERAIEERLKEKQREREQQREPVRGRETDRQDDRNERDGSGGGGRGRSAEGDKSDRREHDEDRRRRPSPNDSRPTREGDYRPPQRSGGGGGDYRPPQRSSGGGDYRPPRSNNSGGGDYRPPARSERGGGEYRPPRGGGDRERDGDRSRENGNSRSYNNDSRDNHDTSDRRPGSAGGGTAADEAARVRRLEEPKAPVFENKNKFAYLLAEDEGADESSDGRDEQ